MDADAHTHTRTHAIHCLMWRSGRTIHANSVLRSLQSAERNRREIIKDKGEEEVRKTKMWGEE